MKLPIVNQILRRLSGQDSRISRVESDLETVRTTLNATAELSERRLDELHQDETLAAKTHRQLIGVIKAQAADIERRDSAMALLKEQVATISEQIKTRADTYKTLAGFMVTASAILVGFQVLKWKDVSDAVEKVAIANAQVAAMRDRLVGDYNQMLGYQTALVQGQYDLLLAIRSEALDRPSAAVVRSDKLVSQFEAMRSFLTSDPIASRSDAFPESATDRKQAENLLSVVNRVLVQGYSVAIRNGYKTWKQNGAKPDDPALAEIKRRCLRLIRITEDSKLDSQPDPYRFLALVALQRAKLAGQTGEPKDRQQFFKEASAQFAAAAKLDREQRIDVANAAESAFLGCDFANARELASDFLSTSDKLEDSQRVTPEFIVACSKEALGAKGAIQGFLDKFVEKQGRLRGFNEKGNYTFLDLIALGDYEGEGSLEKRLRILYRRALKAIVLCGGNVGEVQGVSGWTDGE